MTATRERLQALADEVTALTSIGVSVEPSPPGRGGVWSYIEPPTYRFDEAARVLCRSGRDPRLEARLVVVGPGTAPGQLLALYDAAYMVVLAADGLTKWAPSGDATPADYQGTPCYVIPLTTV